MNERPSVWETIHRGSYPELQDGKVVWSEYYSDYVKTYLERDVRALTAVQDLGAFRQFMVAAASRTAQVLNYSNIADVTSGEAQVRLSAIARRRCICGIISWQSLSLASEARPFLLT